MHYVYVLISDVDRKFYIGYTNALKRRLREHNSGKSLSTKGRRPFTLLYYEAHLSKSDALRREHYFKTTKGKSSLRQMLRDSLNQQKSP